MDYQNGTPNQPQIRQIKLNIFTIFASICGLLAVLSATTVFFGLFFGSLAVIFAILAKGRRTKMDRISRNAFIFGILAIVTSIVVVISTAYLYLHDKEYHDSVNGVYEKIYGEDVDAFMNETYGFDVTPYLNFNEPSDFYN